MVLPAAAGPGSPARAIHMLDEAISSAANAPAMADPIRIAGTNHRGGLLLFRLMMTLHNRATLVSGQVLRGDASIVRPSGGRGFRRAVAPLAHSPG